MPWMNPSGLVPVTRRTTETMAVSSRFDIQPVAPAWRAPFRSWHFGGQHRMGTVRPAGARTLDHAETIHARYVDVVITTSGSTSAKRSHHLPRHQRWCEPSILHRARTRLRMVRLSSMASTRMVIAEPHCQHFGGRWGPTDHGQVEVGDAEISPCMRWSATRQAASAQGVSAAAGPASIWRPIIFCNRNGMGVIPGDETRSGKAKVAMLVMRYRTLAFTGRPINWQGQMSHELRPGLWNGFPAADADFPSICATGRDLRLPAPHPCRRAVGQAYGAQGIHY